jgi:hypothetical protein
MKTKRIIKESEIEGLQLASRGLRSQPKGEAERAREGGGRDTEKKLEIALPFSSLSGMGKSRNSLTSMRSLPSSFEPDLISIFAQEWTWEVHREKRSSTSVE